MAKIKLDKDEEMYEYGVEDTESFDIDGDEEDQGVENEADADGQDPDEPQDDDEEDEGNLVVSFGDEEPPEEEVSRAPEWVRDVRKQNRELQKKIREREQELERLKNPSTENKPVQLGKKPTLENYDYDSDKYETALEQWYEQKKKADQAEAERRAAIQRQEQEWQGRLTEYGKQKKSLKVKDYEDAEGLVEDNFDITQQGIIISASEKPALLVYALGKNLKKARELAKIKDPIKFAYAVAKMEGQLKVSGKRSAPAPEKPIRGTKGINGTVDATLERLRKEAERTGDYTKVRSYKRKIRQSQK